MYQYLSEANEMLENYLLTFSNDDSRIFYKTRIEKFFCEYMSLKHNMNRPINTITYHDLNIFIDSLEYSSNEKLNYFSAFKGFFAFAYYTDLISNDIMKGVKKPEVNSKTLEYIDDKSIDALINFIHNDISAPIEDRLLIGLFLYTGLSRQYVTNLTNCQISLNNLHHTLHFDMGTEVKYVLIKNELVDLIKEFWRSFSIVKPYDKIFSIKGDSISKRVAAISKKVTGKGWTPTHFSNTFIKSALAMGNDILTVSHLTLESVNTIEKHVIIMEEDLLMKQAKILNGLYKR